VCKNNKLKTQKQSKKPWRNLSDHSNILRRNLIAAACAETHFSSLQKIMMNNLSLIAEQALLI